MSQPSTDRRHFSRIHFDAWVELRQGARLWRAAVVDLSLQGLLVREPADWDAADDTIHAAIQLDQSAIIHMNVRCRHRRDRVIGFVCEHIDLESVALLRRLVELNLGDPDLLERELGALGATSRQS